MNHTGFNATCTSHLSFSIRRSAKITDKTQKILSVVVLPTRLERARISPRDFKSLVFANFTTVADECLIILTGFWVVRSKVYPHPLKPQSCYSSRELLAYSCSANNSNVAVFSNFRFGEPYGTRSRDPQIKSLLLYQLS